MADNNQNQRPIFEQVSQQLFKSLSSGLLLTNNNIARNSRENRVALQVIDSNFTRATKQLEFTNKTLQDALTKSRFSSMETQLERVQGHTDESLTRLENAIDSLLSSLGSIGGGTGAGGGGGLPVLPPIGGGGETGKGSKQTGQKPQPKPTETSQQGRARLAQERAKAQKTKARAEAVRRVNETRPGEPYLEKTPKPRPKVGEARPAPSREQLKVIRRGRAAYEKGRPIAYDPLSSFKPGVESRAATGDSLGKYKPGFDKYAALRARPSLSGSFARGAMRAGAYATGPNSPFFWQQGTADVLGATARVAGKTAAGSAVGTAARVVGSLPASVFTMLAAMTTEANPASEELYFSLEKYSKNPNAKTAQMVIQNLEGFKYSYKDQPKAYSDYFNVLMGSALVSDPVLGPYLKKEAQEFNKYWSKPREGLSSIWDKVGDYTLGLGGGDSGIYSIKTPSVSPQAREPYGEQDLPMDKGASVGDVGNSSASLNLNQFLDPSKRGSNHATGLKPEFAQRLGALLKDARAAGIPLSIGSGFRSYQRQKELWEQSDKTGRTVARPGNSMHNFGLAADLWVNGKKLGSKGTEQATKWVHDYVNREGNQSGLHFRMSYEPWHIEPVRGDRKASSVDETPMGTGTGSMAGNVPSTPSYGFRGNMQSPQMMGSGFTSELSGGNFGNVFGNLFGGMGGLFGGFGGLFGSLLGMAQAAGSFGKLLGKRPHKLDSNETRTALKKVRGKVPTQVPEHTAYLEESETGSYQQANYSPDVDVSSPIDKRQQNQQGKVPPNLTKRNDPNFYQDIISRHAEYHHSVVRKNINRSYTVAAHQNPSHDSSFKTTPGMGYDPRTVSI